MLNLCTLMKAGMWRRFLYTRFCEYRYLSYLHILAVIASRPLNRSSENEHSSIIPDRQANVDI